MIEIPDTVLCSAERLAQALTDGGRAEVTVRSKRTGAHVKLTLACKKRKPEGQRGYLSRATVAGRIGLADAHKIDITDPDLEWPEAKVGAFSTVSGRYFNDGGDQARAWTAEYVCRWMRGDYPAMEEQAEILLSTRCCRCGRQLTHPESIAALLGPECAQKTREGRPAPRTPQPDLLAAA